MTFFHLACVQSLDLLASLPLTKLHEDHGEQGDANAMHFAEEDVAATARLLARAGRWRKFSPPWSLPAELWAMIAAPWALTVGGPSREGIGAGAPTEDVLNFDAPPAVLSRSCPVLGKLTGPRCRLVQLHAHARAVGAAPGQANISYGVPIGKKGTSSLAPADNPAANLRLIHCLCPRWSSLFRVMLTKSGATVFAPPPWAYGGIAHRRREMAVAGSLLLAWKLRRLCVSFLPRSYDAKNAFGSGSPEDLYNCAARRLAAGRPYKFESDADLL